MAKFHDEVKKQINTQTRPKVGSMKIETQSSTFVQQPVPGELGVDPVIIWDKIWYSRNRGQYFALEPVSFNDPIASKSTQMIYTNVGNFTDRARIAYCNTRYSGWAGINGGGTISFRVVAEGSMSIYINQEIIYSSGNVAAEPLDLTVSISSRSFIQIYWYAENEGASFNLSGNISRYLTLWEQSDVTPFYIPVLWYPEDPVSVAQYGGGGTIPTAVVTLRWWFGDVVYEDQSVHSLDLGGFGLWQIDFQEIGEIDVMGDGISVPGYYPNARYLKINDIIYKPLYTNANVDTNTTVFIFENHGLTDDDDGRIVEVGTMKLLKNLPIAEFSPGTEIYEVNDADVEWGITYYYLIDSYDASPNRNRGGLTETIQSVTAGDVVAPPVVTNLTGVRNAVDSVTLTWDWQENSDTNHWIVYSDAGSDEYAPIVSSLDRIEMSNYYTFWIIMSENPNGFLISIELPSGEKLVRLVTQVVGAMLIINEDLPTTITSTSTIRFLTLLTTVTNVPPGRPRPRLYDLTQVDALDPDRSGEITVVT